MANFPQYENFKQQYPRLSGIDLEPFLKSYPSKLRSIIVSQIAHQLLRAAFASQTLSTLINDEQRGTNSAAEALLRHVLSMNGITINPDILYGRPIPLTIRQQWEAQGMSPDSENEIIEFLNQHGIASPQSIPHEKLTAYGNHLNLLPTTEGTNTHTPKPR